MTSSFDPTMPALKAIAAMSQNRVIGNGNKIPWHLPEDFKWFKEKTTGQVIVMGRKTFESIGRPLPNRTTVVLSRGGFSQPGVQIIGALADMDWSSSEFAGKEIFICGGAQIYGQTLLQCSELFLTLVKREVSGDAFFPAFEEAFTLKETLRDTPDFKILRYTNNRIGNVSPN